MRAGRVVRRTPDVAYAGANGGSQGRDDPICRDGHEHVVDPQQTRAAPPSAMSKGPRRSEGFSGRSDGAFGDGAGFEEPPEIDEQTARDGDDSDGPHATAAMGEATLEPTCEFRVGLEADPAPGDLNGHGTHRGRAGLGDALVTGFVAALVGRGSETREGGDLFAALDVAPGEELEGEEPSGLEPDALEGHELAYELECGVVGRGIETSALQLFDEADALRDITAVKPLTFETLAKLGIKQSRPRGAGRRVGRGSRD